MSSSPTTTLSRLRAKRAAEDRGFTLIELLVVVVIIGVLVGIAVPVYLNYRKGAEDKSAQSDVRAGISAMEQYYNAQTVAAYPATLTVATTATSPTDPTVGAGWKGSPSNTLGYAINGSGYKLCAQNSSGKSIYVYDSTVGGSVGKVTGTTMTTACVVT